MIHSGPVYSRHPLDKSRHRLDSGRAIGRPRTRWSDSSVEAVNERYDARRVSERGESIGPLWHAAEETLLE
ncbi:unnamed protein product [Heligmosomoides polygyrus]|uniref:DUF309 domain-containing protein n=1 Tax=Heligmosomoides polygyrus TaxID=6339 RepID=A0A183FSN7_HELPZ|nr:unnamed protein product [Heligmosomoides polygyrus]